MVHIFLGKFGPKNLMLSQLTGISHLRTLDNSSSPLDGSRAAATSKIERFMIIVNRFQPLTIITKRSILDVAAALDPPLVHCNLKMLSV